MALDVETKIEKIKKKDVWQHGLKWGGKCRNV